VYIIIREDLRRIFIWKGWKSPVRERFISSMLAVELQQDLIQDSRYHKCKIVPIDQGDELQEFLDAFGLESMELPERDTLQKKQLYSISSKRLFFERIILKIILPI